MDKKEKALKFAEELHKKYPNSLTESESKYIDDDKEHYIATFKQDEIKGSLTFTDKNDYELFLCLIDCVFNSGLEKPTEFAKFNDMMQLIAKKFPNMEVTPHNLRKIAFATSLMLSATKTTQETNNNLI